MPNVTGMTEAEAAARLKENYLTYRIIGDGDKIVGQIPAHGRELPGNSTVLLYTDDSMPTDQVTVPDLKGLTVAQANRLLADCGLYMQAKAVDSTESYVLASQQLALANAVADGVIAQHGAERFAQGGDVDANGIAEACLLYTSRCV